MEGVDLLQIEGLAMNGKIKDAWVEKEGKLARLVAITTDGEKIVSVPEEPGVVAKSFFIVKKYIEWGPLIVENR
ncbi:hypothetical protein IPA_03575 [Ignicoccus pacificus DSM 13166]|uniref:Uncharacterized protein n=1 Tax=Ignicoccus pacificus DSM 13166 TaxID=940294 RepID=A0A977KB12_9CREN|nr:hypothetical protein IPA_03575 [Ignicoccus pacificus DSM 13166]